VKVYYFDILVLTDIEVKICSRDELLTVPEEVEQKRFALASQLSFTSSHFSAM
jgi:predicted RNA-binding protein associated with RNAse of E/G family